MSSRGLSRVRSGTAAPGPAAPGTAAPDGAAPGPAAPGTAAPGRGALGTAALDIAAALVLWVALTMPGEDAAWGPVDLARIPLALLVLVLAAITLPRVAALLVATGFGVVLALVVLLKALNLGFAATLSRPFDVMNDWSYLAAGIDVLTDLVGELRARLVVAAAALAAVGILVLLPLAARRVGAAAVRHRRRAGLILAVLATVWAVAASTGVGWRHGSTTARVASLGTAQLAGRTLASIPAGLADRASFATTITDDPYEQVPAHDLLAGLAGKDVLVVFIESYGRVALDDAELGTTVRDALAASATELTEAGYSARSAWLESPTFGGASWLAHSTVQSGLWVDFQRRYNQLVSTRRLTLTRAFGDAGWRTVFVVPVIDRPWPQGQPFYGFDELYTSTNLGYRGARYGYVTMPDQYTLHAFARRELRPGPRARVMAEIDLLSSHYRWMPPPPLLPPDEVGDGEAFTGPDPAAPDDRSLRELYAADVAYSLRALTSFVAHSGDPDLVVLALGDHQPNRSVTPPGAGHQVPVMLISHDTTVLERVAGWGWAPGLHPASDGPVWRMDAVRDKIFDAFGKR